MASTTDLLGRHVIFSASQGNVFLHAIFDPLADWPSHRFLADTTIEWLKGPYPRFGLVIYGHARNRPPLEVIDDLPALAAICEKLCSQHNLKFAN